MWDPSSTVSACVLLAVPGWAPVLRPKASASATPLRLPPAGLALLCSVQVAHQLALAVAAARMGRR